MWPSFLNPLPALIAAAAAIPLLVLLYFLKLRRQEREVASTLLWKKAIQDLQVNAPFQRLRRNLLLLLQLLLLVLLCLALARPIINHLAAPAAVNVLLIDRSASMSARDGKDTRLDEAKRLATEVVDTMQRRGVATVIVFDETAQTVQPFTTDRAALKRAIASITPTDRPTKLKLAFQLADAQMQFVPEQNRPAKTPPDVLLFSDGKASDAAGLTLQGNLRFVPVGRPESPNLAIVALSARRNYERPNEVHVFARAANYGPEPVSADVRLGIDGKPSRIATVKLPPQRWQDAAWVAANAGAKKDSPAQDSVEFTVDLAEAAVLSVELLNTQDALASDDRAYVVVPPARSLNVVLVTDGNYFLEKALATLPLKKPVVLSPSDYLAKLPEDADVVLFDRWMPDRLPQAGTFVYFGCVPPEGKVSAKRNAAGFELSQQPEVLDWRREHPILRHVSLAKRQIADSLRLSVPLDAQVLVDGSDGPLMVLHREPRRTHLVVAFDLLSTDWPTRPSFPVFLNSAMQFLAYASESNVRESYRPGFSPTLERGAIVQVSPGATSISADGPTKVTAPVPTSGDVTLPPLDQVGVYTTTPPVPPYDKIAINLLDENESNIMPATRTPGSAGQPVLAGAGQARLDLWWWIVALAALPLLYLEWWIYTRRVL
jgi:hypothetical protein